MRRTRHVLWWLCLLGGCAPGPTVELGFLPEDAGAAGASDGSQIDSSENNDGEDEQPTEGSELEDEILPCTSQGECQGLDHFAHCDLELRRCVECLVSSDCEAGETCLSNGSCEAD